MPNPRKPTHLKIVSGTLRKHRENRNEPRPPRVSRPRPPSHLSPRAKAAWRTIAGIADAMGVLTAGDMVALEAVAGALSDLRQARASLAKPMIRVDVDLEGVETARQIGGPGERYYWSGSLRRQRPELSDIASAEARLWAGLAKFGMTPSDRGRVVSAAAEGQAQSRKNPFSKFG